MLRKNSLRLRHLLILLTALGLLPVALIGAWNINAVVEQQRREFERSTLDLSRALSLAVGAELDATVAAVRAISLDPRLDGRQMPAFRSAVQEELRSRPEWVGVVLGDQNGDTIFATGLQAAGQDWMDEESLRRTISTRAASIGRIAKTADGRPAFPVRVPVMSNGQLSYVLTAAVRPDRILAIVRQQNVPDDWVISVHDSTLLRVARSRDHDKTVAVGISPTLAQLMGTDRPEGAGTSRTLDGDEAVTGFTRLQRHGWAVVVGAPATHLSTTLARTLGRYAAGIAGSLLICVLLAVFISEAIVRAIRRLQEQAANLGRGDPVQVQPSRIHEVNQMGVSLQAAAQERLAVEREREALLASLNDALAAQREALVRAEEAGRAKDDFLAVLGHELRNPLAPMVSALDLMEARGEDRLREHQILRRQLDHMRRLVDDLLDVSRITQGKLQVRRETVDLRTVIERAVEAVQPAVLERGRPVEVGVPDNPVWMSGDETRLVQVVTNLLTNALRFDPSGRVSVELRVKDERARIVVKDEGAGMSQEALAHAFRPFYQAPQSLARSAGGLGLGLAIVHSIVDLHGGTVSAHSAGPGKGAAFEVALPVAGELRPAAAAEQPALQSRGGRILVVDDNMDAAETVAGLLMLAGHDVRVAHSARDGAALIAEFDPHVAILDIGLPDMDGFALARLIRDEMSAWRGRLVALTGYGQPHDKQRSSEAGFDLHLTKPVDSEELLRAAA